MAKVEDSYGWVLYKRGTVQTGRLRPCRRCAVPGYRRPVPANTPGESAETMLYYHLGTACRAAGRPEEARHALQGGPLLRSEVSRSPARIQRAYARFSVPTPSAAPPVSTVTADGKPIFIADFQQEVRAVVGRSWIRRY